MCTVIRGSTVVLLALAIPAAAAIARPEARNGTQRGIVDDLVLLRGRVMDPASGLDAVRSVGITGGKIRAVTAQSASKLLFHFPAWFVLKCVGSATQ